MSKECEKKPEGFQRRTILVKKGLQYRYMALIIVSVFVGFLIVGIEVAWTMSRMLAEHPMMQPLLEVMVSMVPFFLMKLGIYMGIVLVVSSVISHRMAGPIYKFEKNVKKGSCGDLTHRIFLRQGDLLTELQDEINGMTAALQSIVKKDRQTVAVMAAKMENVASRLPDENLKAEVLKLKEELSAITSDFKI